MDSAWLVPVALAVGLLLGAGAVVVVVVSAQRGRSAVAVVQPGIPEGAEEVIRVLEAAGIVVDPSNTVVRSSHLAAQLGLVGPAGLAHPALVALVGRARRSDTPIDERLVLPRSTMGDAVVHLTVRAARLGSRYVMLLADDESESYRLEETRRDFVANISHELKTPIGAVGLLAEAVEQAADEPDQVRRFAVRLTQESQRLGRMVGEIIELSRLQALDPLDAGEVVEVDEVVAAAVDRNRVAADANAIRLVQGGTPGLTVRGDRALLVTAVHNLVSNAIQYSTAGTRVGVGTIVADDGVVEISVTDQGVGIAEDEQSRVFERFFRVDPARSRHTGGTGLGLAIVKHVVQHHGGDVRVWSQPGRGSTFTLRLAAADDGAARSQGAR